MKDKHRIIDPSILAIIRKVLQTGEPMPDYVHRQLKQIVEEADERSGKSHSLGH
jgi:hypothetical protein